MSVQVNRIGSVVVVVARDDLSMDDANAIMDLFTHAYQSGTPYAVLFDGRGVSVPPPSVRRRLSESIGTPEEIEKDRGQHIVVVIDNAVLRGVMTAIQWFLPKTVRIQTRKTAAEALEALSNVGHPKRDVDAAALLALMEATDDGWRVVAAKKQA